MGRVQWKKYTVATVVVVTATSTARILVVVIILVKNKNGISNLRCKIAKEG